MSNDGPNSPLALPSPVLAIRCAGYIGMHLVYTDDSRNYNHSFGTISSFVRISAYLVYCRLYCEHRRSPLGKSLSLCKDTHLYGESQGTLSKGMTPTLIRRLRDIYSNDIPL